MKNCLHAACIIVCALSVGWTSVRVLSLIQGRTIILTRVGWSEKEAAPAAAKPAPCSFAETYLRRDIS